MEWFADSFVCTNSKCDTQMINIAPKPQPQTPLTCPRCNKTLADCRCVQELCANHEGLEIRPQTVGELRDFLRPFTDELALKGLNYGAFRYVIDGAGNGQIQYC